MADFKPLNPRLYRRLQRVFGSVGVSNAGVGCDPTTKKGGEQYTVSCCFCGDTRKRLYISHMFGQLGDNGNRLRHLAHCFNSDCIAKGDNSRELTDMLTASQPLEAFPIAKGKPLENTEVKMPGAWKLLSELDDRHPAREYLRSRGFDPDYLSSRYAVGYCVASRYLFAENRIVIPVFMRDILVGWQCRYVGELPWKDKTKKRELPPKYYSCPNAHFRSQAIYNFDQMKNWETGIVVEGPADAWRVGPMAGSIFGNTITAKQKQLLLGAFRRRSLVLLLDPEEFESDKTVETIREFKAEMGNRFAAIKLADGTDPGSLDQTFLRDYVCAAAEEQGVEVHFRKVKEPVKTLPNRRRVIRTR